jgi:hypothetical protein
MVAIYNWAIVFWLDDMAPIKVVGWASSIMLRGTSKNRKNLG